MSLTQRQMNCFERNSQFLTEVAAALLPIAAQMKKGAMVVRSNPQATEVEQSFALAHEALADQILREQGITIGANANSSVTATSGSTAMKYLVQQMLMSSAWDMTPDEWAADEMTARAAIQAGMAALLQGLTAIPASS